MKHRRLLVLILALPSLAAGQTVSLASRVTGLAPVPTDRAAATVAVSAGKAGLGVGVVSEFNCDTKPSNARVFQYRGTITISVESVATSSGPPIGALCATELQFVLKGLSAGPKVVYYVQDGHVLGHSGAP